MEILVDCVMCADGVSYLKKDSNDIMITHKVSNGYITSKVFVDFISYKCDKCDLSFTTSEMDDINMDQIDKKRKILKRKNTISNILN
jgi:hypothetical protein